MIFRLLILKNSIKTVELLGHFCCAFFYNSRIEFKKMQAWTCE